MHDYSMRGHPRERLIYYLAAAAFSLMPLLQTLSGWVGVGFAVSTFAVFYGLFLLVEHVLWKLDVFRKLFRIPDLNGEWSCDGTQFDSHGEVKQEWTAKVTITQTWSRISIALKTGTSRSRSGPASLEVDAGHGYRLLFNYQNDPDANQPELKPHSGTCELNFDEVCRSGHGRYFTDHNRQSFGTMKLTRNSSHN